MTLNRTAVLNQFKVIRESLPGPQSDVSVSAEPQDYDSASEPDNLRAKAAEMRSALALHHLRRAGAPETLTFKPNPLDPQPSTLNPHPSTLNPQPSTLNPKS